jgi:hypothetical protein
MSGTSTIHLEKKKETLTFQDVEIRFEEEQHQHRLQHNKYLQDQEQSPCELRQSLNFHLNVYHSI